MRRVETERRGRQELPVRTIVGLGGGGGGGGEPPWIVWNLWELELELEFVGEGKRLVDWLWWRGGREAWGLMGGREYATV